MPLVVVVAARDEAAYIAATLTALRQGLPHAQLWVADDGSRDATAQIATAAGARVVRGQRPVGKGSAMSAVARAALAEIARDERDGPSAGAPVFLLCDGDLGPSASALQALVDAVVRGDADLAVGVFARRRGGGLGLARGFARWAIRRSCGVDTRAPLSGQRALSMRALSDVLPFAHGYGMEVGMTIDAVRAGHRLLELELDLTHRVSGLTPAGFAHRARQLLDIVRAYAGRRNLAPPAR